MSAERIFALIETARAQQASDLHIEPGEGAALRVFTHIRRLDGPGAGDCDVAAFLDLTADRLARTRLERLGIADTAYGDSRIGTVRIHASRGKRGNRLAIRLLARAIPELDSLLLPSVVGAFAALNSGLVLVAGPTGSGKSTTIASLLDRVNAQADKHIVTFEDPIEYQHRWQRSIVTQYEVGRDVANFPDGVRAALRADPDIVFIGEVRDADTVAACLQAAETGHLVFAAIHTPSETPLAINRLIGLFPSNEQERARARIADALRGLVGMRLLPLQNGSGLRAAVEIALSTEAVRRLIRDGATHQLRSTIASSRKEGMQTLESHLYELVRQGDVALPAARAVSSFPDEIREGATNGVRRY